MSETRILLAKTKEGDLEARKLVVEENLNLVHHVVKRFAGRGYDLQDLFQIGSIGLLKAVDHFDLTKDVCFSTYAVPMIMGEIRRFLRDDGMIRVSRSIKENAVLIHREREKIRKEEGREARMDEICRRTGLKEDAVIEATEAFREVESIDKSICNSDGKQVALVELLRDERNEKEEIVNRLVLMQLLECLEQNERELILLRYLQNKTQTEVAHILSMSQVQVSRKEKKILLKLRNEYFGNFSKK